MKVDLKDRRTGWLIVSYLADTIRQARERLRQMLRHEERKRDEFLAGQEKARQRAARLAERCAAAVENPTDEQRKAIKELQQLSRMRIEWDEHAMEYKRGKHSNDSV